jgi:hypothetical protein
LPTIKGDTFLLKLAQNRVAFQEPLNHTIEVPEFRAAAELFHVVNEERSIVVPGLEPL